MAVYKHHQSIKCLHVGNLDASVRNRMPAIRLNVCARILGNSDVKDFVLTTRTSGANPYAELAASSPL